MKHLKDLTTYSGTDKFKDFRETLVNELQENLEIIDENLGTGGSGGSGELEVIKKSMQISSGSSSNPLQKWIILSDSKTLDYNQLIIEITLNSEKIFVVADTRLSKLKGSATYQKFDLVGRKYDNTTQTSIFKHALLCVQIGTSSITLYMYFDNEDDVEKCYFDLYGSK